MAGPGCSILLREAPSAELEDRVRVLLGGLAERVQGSDFWVEGRPFKLSTKGGYPGALEERVEEGLADLIGWTPAAVITVAAMCNNDMDHRLLGEVCLRIAGEFRGIIDFGGVISAGPKLDGAKHSPLVVDNPDGLRGRMFATSCEGQPGWYFTSHFGDATLLEAWLRDPRFRMVK